MRIICESICNFSFTDTYISHDHGHLAGESMILRQIYARRDKTEPDIKLNLSHFTGKRKSRETPVISMLARGNQYVLNSRVKNYIRCARDMSEKACKVKVRA